MVGTFQTRGLRLALVSGCAFISSSAPWVKGVFGGTLCKYELTAPSNSRPSVQFQPSVSGAVCEL